jgi:hypothetical protein
MLKTYGKLVEELLTTGGKSWVSLSTYGRALRAQTAHLGVKPRLTPTFIPKFYTHISPTYFALSPLAEHIFYPVSTGPINNPTKQEIKERY